MHVAALAAVSAAFDYCCLLQLSLLHVSPARLLHSNALAVVSHIVAEPVLWVYRMDKDNNPGLYYDTGEDQHGVVAKRYGESSSSNICRLCSSSRLLLLCGPS